MMSSINQNVQYQGFFVWRKKSEHMEAAVIYEIYWINIQIFIREDNSDARARPLR